MSKKIEEPRKAVFEAERNETSKGLKVRRIGNSLGVILPKDVVSALRVRDGDDLEYAVTGDQAIELRNVEDEADRLMKSAEKIMAKNRSVLRALAK